VTSLLFLSKKVSDALVLDRFTSDKFFTFSHRTSAASRHCKTPIARESAGRGRHALRAMSCSARHPATTFRDKIYSVDTRFRMGNSGVFTCRNCSAASSRKRSRNSQTHRTHAIGYRVSSNCLAPPSMKIFIRHYGCTRNRAITFSAMTSSHGTELAQGNLQPVV
jgi:hypothetical protein